MSTEPPLPAPVNRNMITLVVMLAAIMTMLDSTIANVALPHMQSTMLASSEQIVWILTSYFIASAIAIPLTGWLAGKLHPGLFTSDMRQATWSFCSAYYGVTLSGAQLDKILGPTP